MLISFLSWLNKQSAANFLQEIRTKFTAMDANTSPTTLQSPSQRSYSAVWVWSYAKLQTIVSLPSKHIEAWLTLIKTQTYHFSKLNEVIEQLDFFLVKLKLIQFCMSSFFGVVFSAELEGRRVVWGGGWVRWGAWGRALYLSWSYIKWEAIF